MSFFTSKCLQLGYKCTRRSARILGFTPFVFFNFFLHSEIFTLKLIINLIKEESKDFIGEKIITGLSEDSELIEEVGFC